MWVAVFFIARFEPRSGSCFFLSFVGEQTQTPMYSNVVPPSTINTNVGTEKKFFFASCGSLIPFTRDNAQWVFHGFLIAL